MEKINQNKKERVVFMVVVVMAMLILMSLPRRTGIYGNWLRRICRSC